MTKAGWVIPKQDDFDGGKVPLQPTRQLTAGLPPSVVRGMAPYAGAAPDPAVDTTSKGPLRDGVRRSRSNLRDAGIGDLAAGPRGRAEVSRKPPAPTLGAPLRQPPRKPDSEVLGADTPPPVHGYEVTTTTGPAPSTLAQPLPKAEPGAEPEIAVERAFAEKAKADKRREQIRLAVKRHRRAQADRP